MRTRQLFVLLLCASLLCVAFNASHPVADDYWLLDCGNSFDTCGYVDRNGVYRIPRGKYWPCYTDTFRSMAIVSMPYRGFVAIDRNEKILFDVFGFDNAPDEVSEGLFRICKDTLVGYATPEGKIAILPKYRFAMRFSEGLAAFSWVGTSEWDKSHEHQSIRNAKFGYINGKGEVIIQPQFTHALEFENGEARVWIGKASFCIDRTGKRVRDFK